MYYIILITTFLTCLTFQKEKNREYCLAQEAESQEKHDQTQPPNIQNPIA